MAPKSYSELVILSASVISSASCNSPFQQPLHDKNLLVYQRKRRVHQTIAAPSNQNNTAAAKFKASVSLRGGSDSGKPEEASVIISKDGYAEDTNNVIPNQQATIEVLQRDRQTALQYLKGEKLPSNLVKANNKDEKATSEGNDVRPSQDSSNHFLEQERAETTCAPLTRTMGQLDGMEVGAIVSGLLLVASLCMYELLSQHWVWRSLLDFMGLSAENKMKWYDSTLALDMASRAFSVMGIVTSLHATLVFSCVAFHGRSFWDKHDLEDFVGQTTRQWKQGLWSFRTSLYIFCALCCFLIQHSVPRETWKFTTPLLFAVVWKFYRDTRSISNSVRRVLLSNQDRKSR